MKKSETVDLIKRHRSIRKFRDEAIPKEQIKEIIRAGQSAASSHFVQAYSVILVEDQKKKDKIAEVAKQSQVSDAPVFLLFCVDFKRLEIASKKHNSDFKYDTVENVIVGTVDSSLVAQNVLLAAESLGYGGCYVGGIRNNLEPIDEVVGLPDKVFPLFGMTLGVPAIDPEVKPRLPIDAVLHENEYDVEKYDDQFNDFNETIKEYYASRSQNTKNMDWTSAMAQFFSDERRAYLGEYLKKKGFHLK